MLEIKNLNKIIGDIASTERVYTISDSYENTVVGYPAYQFITHFDNDSVAKRITIYRKPNLKNEYELFVMGWHGVSVEILSLKEVKSYPTFRYKIGVILDKLYKYIQENHSRYS